MKTDELRQKYLDFFVSKGHALRPSDVLVPTWDPSVLFTPAGMNQFKDHFLGRVKLEFTRAVTCQKCLRTGDIENVGRTAYHHTFFEMLGNFSFGDYFKRDAINWAWEFLTEKNWLGIDPERLTATVYKDDEESAEIWARDVGLSADRIERMDEDENFWPAGAPSQGPDGVCGPCSEIFYHGDHGESVEIWNLVFTQFNRVGDGPNNLRPLPSKNIDTGMGLERTAAALQGAGTNYHIDILRPIVEAAAEICRVRYDADSEQGRRLRRITDHVRACTFAIHENVYPGPNKEKYVVRRLLRRAVLDGHQLGVHEPFLHRLAPVVVEIMKTPYPELVETGERVAGVIRREEENFFATIDAGLARIERAFGEMKRSDRVLVDGGEAADLYQTYGVPPELTEAMAAEQNFTFDWEGFHRAMQQHGEASGRQKVELFQTGPIEALKNAIHATEFLGYETIEADCRIKGIIAQDHLCDRVTNLGHDQPIVVVLDRTPFYGESGGQVGDTGEIFGDHFRFQVTDAQRDGDLVLHRGHLCEGKMFAGAKATARVDAARRQGIRRAHSATHLLHYALRKHLGDHAQQQGSKVDDDWLRFDFTHLAQVTPDELAAIENDVCRLIEAGDPIAWTVLPMVEARKAGAMMLFGEKYPDPVRMVSIGDYSRELCGGTHLSGTDQVDALDIISEEAVAAGTRRITALTGRKARENIEKTRSALVEAAAVLGVSLAGVPAAAKALSRRVREMKKQLAGGGTLIEDEEKTPPAEAAAEPGYAEMKHALRRAARTLAVSPFDVPARLAGLVAEVEQLRSRLDERKAAGPLSADALLAAAVAVGDARIVVAETPGAGPPLMRQLIDQLRKKASPCAVLLAAREGEQRVTLVAGISRDLVRRGVDAGSWVRQAAKIVGGRGGGKPDMAQAGGKEPDKLPEALDAARNSIQDMLGAEAGRGPAGKP